MQDADAAGEAFGEAPHGLWRQCDLRHERDPAPSETHRVRERIEVDLGLAAARDAVQQQRAAVAAIDRGADGRPCRSLLVQQLDRRARGHVEVAQRVALVEHLDNLDEPGVAQVLDRLARAGAELARELAHAQLDRGLAGEPFEQRRARGLRARARQLADAALGGSRIEGEPHVALPVDLQQTVGDERLHGRRTARDPSKLIERDRLAVGVEERAQRAPPPRGAPPLDVRGECARSISIGCESHDLDDARPTARPRQFVAALGEAAPDERTKRRVEAARADGRPQLADLAGRLVEQFVEPLLALGERRGSRTLAAHDQRARALACAGRQHQRVRLPRRREVVLGDPRRELQLRRVEARCALDAWEQLADVAGVARQVGGILDDHALQLLPPEGDVYDLARLDLAAVRDAVRERHERGPAGVDGHLHKARAGLARRFASHAAMIRSEPVRAHNKTDVRYTTYFALE